MHTPNLEQIDRQARKLADIISQTPVVSWNSNHKNELLDQNTEVFFKLELFQVTGSFKIRGAYTVISNLTDIERAQGVVAGTAGNHGIAVAHASDLLKVLAKIVIPKTINPYRLSKIKEYSCEIHMVNDVSEIITTMNQIAKIENRVIVHPFDNPNITLGTATLGYELMKQISNLDVVIVPIGGGGLASGVACAVKLINPRCQVYGVEPEHANSMSLSLQSGKALVMPDSPKSIADSLCAPKSEDYSFGLCQKYLDQVVLVSDSEIKNAMKVLLEELKLFTEPAGATSTAGLLGPLKSLCQGKRVGAIVCGSNIDLKNFSTLVG